ncbi:MAG: T9SS type A sorting domain-containing protein [Labilibaculum sp.]|nr:T9SS type A sorting domain-containing protein [Labilibaculum sp.]MBI9059340.1 T9SS type A sorting domain-containing protein [Labilibaculum sp.]
MKYLSTFILIGFFSISSFQVYAQVNANRPRIELGKERFDWLKSNISSGDSGDTYSSFKNSYDNNWITDSDHYLAGSDANQWSYSWNSTDAFVLSKMTAFLLQLGSDNLAKDRCEFIIGEYITYLDGINFNNYSGDTQENLLRNNCDYGGILLDWTYDHINSTLRQDLAVSFYRMLEFFMENYILTSSGNSYVSSHNIRNCVMTMRAAIALHGADGLSSSQKTQVNSWFTTLLDKWESGILPAFAHFRDDDGAWNWGAAYGMFGFPPQYQLFDDMKYGTDRDYYQSQAWIKESINQYWYFYRPDNYCIHLGDAIVKLDQANRVMYRHAAEYDDARSKYLVQMYNQSQYLRNSNLVFAKLMYKDFTQSTVPHPQPPLNYWADKTGLSVSRTSWNEDATMLWFYNAPAKRTDHEHRDNNTFTIIKDKPLIVDAGFYDSYATSHYNNYYSRTIAHNSICVYDGTESYRNLGRSVSNDGGQIESDRLENLDDVFSEEHKRGKWIRYASADHYSYQVADAADSYQSNKLDRFERRLLYHKPDRVIVLDHLHLLNTSSRVRKAKYINHFVNKPTINGNVTNTQVADRIVTYNGKDYKTTNGKGSVAIRTLLPELTSTTLIGGSGYEYWVDGTNYPPNQSIDLENEHPGYWRIEVEPTAVKENQVFLHTIKIADNTNPANAGGKLHSNETSIGIDWENHLYLFHAEGDTASISYSVSELPGNRSITVFALDLKSNTTFGVFIDEVLKRTGDSNSDGILELNVDLSEGNHTLVVKDTIAGDPDPDDPDDPDPDDPDPDDPDPEEPNEERLGLVKVYPNPNNGEFSIEIDEDEVNEFVVNIYDSNGRMMSQHQESGNRADLDLSALTAGLYFLVIKYMGKTVKKKIVII